MKIVAKRRTHEEFVQEVYDLVGDEYIVLDKFTGVDNKIRIKHNCKKCNNYEWLVAPQYFLRGNRCLKCSGKLKKTHEEFVQEVYDLVGDEYTVLGKYKTTHTKIKMRHNDEYCDNNEYDVKPTDFLSGNRCPKCMFRSVTKGIDSFKEEVYDLVGDEYTVLSDAYINNGEKIIIQHNAEYCSNNTYSVRPIDFTSMGRRCAICSAKKVGDSNRKSLDTFKTEVYNLVGTDYVVLGDYIDWKTKTLFRHNIPSCKNEFEMRPGNFITNGNRCPKCAKFGSISNAEIDIICFIKNYYSGEIRVSDRSVLSGSEIDVYLPDINLGIEYNGFYWHSDKFKDKDYHLKKLNKAHEAGINLLFIDEVDWLNKENICKARILYHINGIKKSIYARNTELYFPTPKEEKEFLNRNHIQGYIASSIKIALKYEDNIVALLSFTKSRKNVNQNNENEVELLRYATNIDYVVPGGFSKLLKNSIPLIQRKYEDIKIITTFSDNNLSYGNLYEKNGFTLDHISKPSYFYVYQKKKYNRFTFRKSELKRLFPEYALEGLTEFQITDSIPGMYRVWNTGNNVYKLDINIL